MPTNYGSRLILICAVLLVCLFGFPGVGGGILKSSTLFGSVPFAQKTNLKPGIDIAGGTSLIYQIKIPQGAQGVTASGQTMAEEVAAALKKRVDPQGVLNLVWRPQGADRLEIQIPRSPNSGKREEAQKQLTAAQEQLKRTLTSMDDVKRAIEKSQGEERDRKLTALAAGSKERLALFKEMAQTYDQLQKANADFAAAARANDGAAKEKAAGEQARAELKYDELVQRVSSSNLSLDEIQRILDLPPEPREQQLAQLKAQFADYPARVKAIDDLAAADAKFKQYKGSLDDAADLKRMLRGSGVLEFHILVTDYGSPEAQAMIERLRAKGPAPQANDTMKWYVVDNSEEFKQRTFQMEGDNTKRFALAYITDQPLRQMIHRRDANPWSLEAAYPTNDPTAGNAVGFRFDAQGAKLFGELTRNNLHQPLAIVLDERMISAPNINSEITSNGIITGGGAGGFSPGELKYLVNTLSAGSLPATLADEPISERTVSPQLGVDNLYRGLLASGIGLVVVSVFLIGYYHLAGLVAFIAVMMNLVIILGVLAMFGATFTMPSIAGIVLTVGTAIDANVLIFERMREEEHRGFPLKLALQHAYDRALSAIVDSNVTTAITSVCLYIFGSEEVRGFGLTLLIGILSSLFTALFVTKTIFAILIDKYDIKELGSIPTRYPKWDKLLKPNIDWMSMIWPFVAFSVIFIVAGMSAFLVKKRDMFDIEFASGTSVQFELKHDMPIAQVRERINTRGHEIPSASVVSLNNREDLYEVVTPNDKAAEVRDAVLAAMGTDLNIQLPSKFQDSQSATELNVTPVVGKAVLPIEKESFELDGRPVPGANEYVGGAAILLRSLEPPISPNEIRSRIDRAAASPGSEMNLSKWRIDVERLDRDTSADAANHPTKDAIVLVSNPDFPYGKNADNWRENTAAPMWKLVNEGVNREAKLQKVSNFDPQVAGDTQRDALLATLVSIVLIMIYIWFRFGDMRFATATVVALVHDTLVVIGAIGLSHYLDNSFGHVFLVEPFRINLTLVAAILTVMGYSMLDTIVVFDRIRENRGRYGTVTRKVINDSVNQTLSRTLLTAGTTIVMVAVMYICGGAGIHGFTFVLLVGILFGTYSSIAIASPILLLHGRGKGARPEPPQTGAGNVRKGVGQAQRLGAPAADVTSVSVNRAKPA